MAIRKLGLAGVLATGLVFTCYAAGPQETYNPQCFKPAAGHKIMTMTARPGPYRVALANGFAGNSWRIQMIQGLKAWAARPENAKEIKELKIVSTGTDVAAQIGAIDNLIAAGYDAIITIAVNPTSFEPVIKRARKAGVVLVPFDNVLDTDQVIQVTEPQVELETVKAQFVYDNMPEKKGKVLEIRGLPGNSVDRDRSIGFHKVFDNKPGIEVVTVVGNWDDGTVQKVVSDAIATQGPFAGIVAQHGSTGLMNALSDAKHPKVPLGTSGENGSLKMIHDQGWTAIARVQSPLLAVVAMKAAIAELQGHPIPQLIQLPVPTLYSKDLKDGVNYSSKLPDNFQDGADIKACNVVIPIDELLKQTPDNT
ncbi:sugar ABC transporter substrate-binding protein [Rhodopila globiformis]|nr:sugar ABC transporter substrate-binding protein [Rhodopila globiformis]